MFVINLKFDLKKIFLTCLIIAAAIAMIIEFGLNDNSSLTSANTSDKYDYILDESNYTEILKTIHNDIDGNLNKTVKMVGYVFRMPDFKEDYFVCGRNTISNNEDHIAGFLCQSKETPKLADNEWIEITGVIIKGSYNGDMPVIKVGSIKKVEAPANTFVETRDENTTQE